MLVLVLLVPQVLWTYHYARVFGSELTLAAHAARLAPRKPRAVFNYGRALLLSGELGPAAALFDQAELLAAAPHVPAWDRADVQVSAAANRRLLLALSVVGREP